MYVISKQQNKKILVVSLYQNAKTHVLCYNVDLLSRPSLNQDLTRLGVDKVKPKGWFKYSLLGDCVDGVQKNFDHFHIS